MFERAGLVTESNKAVIGFGITRLGMTLTDWIFAMIFAGVMGNGMAGFLFELSYMTLRIYAGGYHASSRKKCFYLTYISTAVCIVCAFIVPVNVKCMAAVLIVAVAFIAIAAPVQSENKPLNKAEVKVYHRNAVCLAVTEMGLCAFFYVIGREIYAKSIFLSIVLTAFGLWIEVLRKSVKTGQKIVDK